MSVFSDIPASHYLLETALFFVVYDRYPVTEGHALVISKAERPDYLHLTPEEKAELLEVVDATQRLLAERYAPAGYNIGMNCGEVAGQTIPHFHCHVIPRYPGDTPHPRGGVRGVIPSRQAY